MGDQEYRPVLKQSNKPKSRRVNIISKDEPSTIVRLEDGTIINIRIAVFGAHIMLNEDGLPKLNPDSSPLYAVNHQVCLFIDTFESVPENVKRN